MENEDVIREQMEDTRTAMTEKIEKLEQKVVGAVSGTTDAVTESVEAVKDTVKSTTEAVTETVEAVKETVQETVHTVTDTVKGGLRSVRDFFSPRKHPWICMGASVVTGFVVGKLLLPRRTSSEAQAMASAAEPVAGSLPRGSGGATGSHSAIAAGMTAAGQGRTHGGSRDGGSRNGGHHRERSHGGASKGWLQGISDTLGPELDKVKGMALGMLLDAARDLLTRAVPPQWKGHLMGIFHNLAHKLHAEPQGDSPQEQPEEQRGYSTAAHEEERHGDRGKQDMERSGNRGGKRHKFDR